MSTSNFFSAKFQSKSTHELMEIADPSNTKFTEEAKQAALMVLDNRKQAGTLKKDAEENKPKLTGELKYQDFLKSLERKSSFGFTPKYEEKMEANIRYDVIYALAKQVFEDLEWDIRYVSKECVAAHRGAKIDGRQSELILININPSGELTVTSKSEGNEMWDLGRNAKWVRLFIHVYRQIESTYEEEQITSLAEQLHREENWDDYEIPESLPQPSYSSESYFISVIIAAVVGVTVLAGTFAFLSKFVYIIFLYESLIGMGLAFILNRGMRLGNYPNGDRIFIVMCCAVVSIVVLNQYFQYLFIIYEQQIDGLSFLDFVVYRVQAGFMLKNTNTGWIGWVVIFLLQLTVIGISCWFRMFFYITNYHFERVPQEVTDFAYYHFVKGKTEVEVRNELALKGWGERQKQDDVFAAMAAVQEQQEYAKG